MTRAKHLPAGIAQDLLTVLAEVNSRAYAQQVAGEVAAAAVLLEDEALAALEGETPRLAPKWRTRAEAYLSALEADALEADAAETPED